jgi:hypothetical protein
MILLHVHNNGTVSSIPFNMIGQILRHECRVQQHVQDEKRHLGVDATEFVISSLVTRCVSYGSESVSVSFYVFNNPDELYKKLTNFQMIWNSPGPEGFGNVHLYILNKVFQKLEIL